MKKILKWILQIPCQLYNKLIFLYRKPICKNKPTITGRIYIVSDKNKIYFGKNVMINSNLQSNPIGGSTRTILFAKPDAEIKLGDNVAISNSALFAAKSIILEENVMIGGNCVIYDSDFHSLNYHERIKENDNDINVQPVIIKRGAFIGAHSIILKGVSIGEESIVAAGSVVTKNIPPKEIWGGNPAKYIRNLA